MFHPIELDRWERKDTFQNFMDLDCSYSVTQDLCVTPFHAHVRARGLRFYPAFSWAVLYAVNRHREFRMGLDGEGRPGYYDEIHAEYGQPQHRLPRGFFGIPRRDVRRP